MEFYGFKDRETAERLKNFARGLSNESTLTIPTIPNPLLPGGVGQHRSYWIVPKGTIPATIDELTPGVGKAFICRLDREASPPKIARFKYDGQDVEVDVYNYTSTAIVEDGLESIVRVNADIFGELAILPQGDGSKIALVQAPISGIPARVGRVPGSASCQALEVATVAGTGYGIGDLILTEQFYSIKNWSLDIIGADGDRVVQVEGHFNGAFLMNSDCNNTATTFFPTKTLVPLEPEEPPPEEPPPEET